MKRFILTYSGADGTYSKSFVDASAALKEAAELAKHDLASFQDHFYDWGFLSYLDEDYTIILTQLEIY
jgi:hypothetical protein